VAISAFMILRSPRRFAFAKLLVMTYKFKVFMQSKVARLRYIYSILFHYGRMQYILKKFFLIFSKE